MLLGELDRFRFNQNEKTGNTELNFWNGHDWIALTNINTGKFLAEGTLSRRMGGMNVMVNMLGLEEPPSRSQIFI